MTTPSWRNLISGLTNPPPTPPQPAGTRPASRTMPLGPVTVQVQLNASGNGTVSNGPTGSGEVWTNITASVHCATNTSEATCRFFAGPDNSARNFVDGTTWGSTGASTSKLPPTLPRGQQIFVTWTGGDPNTVAYLTLAGTRQVA